MAKEMEDWSDNEFALFSGLNMPPEAEDDRFIQMLFDIVYFSPDENYVVREASRTALIDMLWNDYGVIFEEAFDWEAYRLNGESDG